MKKVQATIKILNWVSGAVIYESNKPTFKEAVEEAIKNGANMSGADMSGANMSGADMSYADMSYANMSGADMSGANMSGADMRYADMSGADMSDADMSGANMSGADMRYADMRGANMRGIPLANLPRFFVNSCSRDILFVLEHLKAEVPFLRDKLIKGEVDGSQYEGECACLIGTLGNADGGVDAVCKAIPFYEKSAYNPGETWFLNIREGDTPENNEFAKHVLTLIDTVLAPTPKDSN